MTGPGGQEMNEQPLTTVLEVAIVEFLIKIQFKIKKKKLNYKHLEK